MKTKTHTKSLRKKNYPTISILKSNYFKYPKIALQLTLLICALLFNSCKTNAQWRPLKGSGKLITKQIEATPFTEIVLNDLPNKVTISIANEYSIKVTVDDNLENLLQTKIKDNALTISLLDNEKNKKYIESTGFEIAITLPLLTYLKSDGNANVIVKNFAGNDLKLKIGGNGDTKISGITDVASLTVKKSGNGNLDLSNLLCGKVVINMTGNGDTNINTNNTFTATIDGNGNLTNVGEGKASKESSSEGNGKIATKN